MLQALICFVLIVVAVPSWGAPDVMSVDRNGTLTHLLPDGFEEATVHEAPANGRVQIDGRSLEYWPNQGFEGLDRVEVEATSNQSYILQIVVGDPRPAQINVIYEQLAALLFVLAIVAIVLEVAFTALFNNRAFRKLNWFPGIKTLVAFGGSAVVVWVFQFDIFGEIMRAISASDAFLPGAGWVSGGITALLLAGGSGTVFYLYTKLGIRNPFGQG
ncbi:MAG: hypothetical protein AAGA78_04470, partial [Pseudomonadota bacterium]